MAMLTDNNGVYTPVRDDYVNTGTITALAGEVVIDLRGANQVIAELRTIAAVMTIAVEGSTDGVNYRDLPGQRRDSLGWVLSVVLASATVELAIPSGGYRFVRLRPTAYTSGTVAITLRASLAAVLSVPVQLPPYPSTLHVTATGAAGAAVTLTLPAPGAGLRQYVRHLRIDRFQSALGVAAATPVLITTTNLPGSPVYSVSQRAAEQGALETLPYEYGAPLQATAQNTALTFVAPVQAQTLWRLSAWYHVAP
jgi:hypothetical protein